MVARMPLEELSRKMSREASEKMILRPWVQEHSEWINEQMNTQVKKILSTLDISMFLWTKGAQSHDSLNWLSTLTQAGPWGEPRGYLRLCINLFILFLLPCG